MKKLSNSATELFFMLNLNFFIRFMNHRTFVVFRVVPTKCFGVGVSCRNLYLLVVYLV